MASLLGFEIGEDGLAVSVATAVHIANRLALEDGIDLEESLVAVEQVAYDDGFRWRVEYGPRDVNQRGGDLIVEVNPTDGSVDRVIRGQ